jgi:flagellar basal-body rod modification protein FlgD
VTASDFLQLLVSEMKNQDPTANTDPNEYINQLVQVNSLEQLIQINQDLGDASSASGGSGTSGSAASAPSSANAAIQTSGKQDVPASGRQAGNLSMPGPSAAAVRVGHALEEPSATVSAADPRNHVHTPGSHSGVLRSTINTAR